MKTIFMRTLMVALLATSISAFAQSGNGNRDDAASPEKVTQQSNCSQDKNHAVKQDEQDQQKSSEEQQIEQEDNDWLHNVQGTFGG